MLFYTTLFLIFIYFKLARVHKKEEQSSQKTYTLHAIVALSAIALYGYGIDNYSFLTIVIISFLFFIVAALMVTAVQVGVFVDGKPFIKMSNLYKAMPILSAVIAIFTLAIYFI
jgi:hypothetical protein